MNRLRLVLALLLALASPALAQGPTIIQQVPQRFEAAIGVVHSHTSAATLTINGVAGQYIYVTAIDVMDCGGATQVTGAAPLYMTTTNLTGAPQYQMGSGGAVGGGQCTATVAQNFAAPLKASAAGTNVTFVLPAFATNQTLSVNVYYLYAP